MSSSAQPPRRASLAARMGVATTAVAAAVAIRWMLTPLLGEYGPLLLFTLPVMIAARFGGFGAGLFATGLSAAAGEALFVKPTGRVVLDDPVGVAYLSLFLAVGGGISWLADLLRRAQEATAEAGEQKRLLAEALPQLVWTCEPDGRCDYFNRRWVEYTGIPAAEQLGFAWLDQVHPEDREPLLAAWREAVAGGDFRVEFRIRRHDGVYRWFDTRALAQRDAAGRVVKWFGSNTDIDEARLAREALRIEQDRLRTIAETAPGVLCSFRLRPDGSACFPYASPRIREIYGLDPADVVNDAAPIFDRIRPEDAPHVWESIAESARAMTPWRHEFRVLNPARGEIWVEGHTQPAKQADGSIEWHGFIRDITARRRMVQELRDRTAALEELTRTLDLAHAIVRTFDGAITYWSEGAAAMYGWRREEAVGRVSHELLKTEYPLPVEELHRRLMAEGRWEGELRNYRRDGTPVVVASHWALHRDAEGRPCSVIEVNNDISEQKRVERELRASEERLELAQAAAGIGAWDWDLTTGEVNCSEECRRLFGPPDAVRSFLSEKWLARIHPEDRAAARESLWRARDGAGVYNTEFRVVAADGGVRWLMGKGQTHRDASGKPTRMVGIYLDITERKKAAEQLRALSASLISAQEQERRRVSRELHDDLVQRMGLMAIDLGKLIPEFSPAPELTDELRLMQERAVQAAELARHIAHELHPLILEDLGIATALRSLCEDAARREEIEVDFATGDLPRAITREAASALYAVAQESLVNVAKHARARRVEVRLGGGEDAVRLTIADDGVGFPAGAEAGGVGLGIVNMRERVRWLKGSFTVDSEAGRGARIVVEIPLPGESNEARAYSAG